MPVAETPPGLGFLGERHPAELRERHSAELRERLPACNSGDGPFECGAGSAESRGGVQSGWPSFWTPCAVAVAGSALQATVDRLPTVCCKQPLCVPKTTEQAAECARQEIMPWSRRIAAGEFLNYMTSLVSREGVRTKGLRFSLAHWVS